MTQGWWMHFVLCSWGWRQGVASAIALHIVGTWRGNPDFVIITLAVVVAISIAVATSVVVPDSITITVLVAITIAIGHCRCGCHRPSPPPSLLRHRQPLPLPLQLPSPSPSAIVVSVTIGHRSCHIRWPSLSPLPSAISESCCLGAARIVFIQLKPRMLTLFYFVRTVGGALIKARWLTRCWTAMANTSVGRQAASSERLVRKVAGSREAAGGQQGGDVDSPWESVVFLCCWGISHWQMAFVMMCWIW